MSRHAVRMFVYVLFFVPAAGISAMAQVEPKAATEATKKAKAAVLNQLPFADKQDFEDANRGFVATVPELEVKDDKGNVVWMLAPYKFLEAEEAADTVNPSLWRQSRLNMTNGLSRSRTASTRYGVFGMLDDFPLMFNIVTP